ncbi:guanine nucleotide exchange factor synembryn-domain-containing protein [Xylaria intraflava]|nr:guanine nucleotide exchange factor synembryn-domain-containing protein [Xylaria intraflava]
MTQQFDRPRPGSFWRIFSSAGSYQGSPTEAQGAPFSMAANPQLAQATMLSGPGEPHHSKSLSRKSTLVLTDAATAKLAAVTSLVEKLTIDLDSINLLPHQRDEALEELKVYGRDPRSADPIFTKEGIEMLTRHAFNSPSSTTSRNALRCLCNALLLKTECRQMFVDLGYEAKACNKLRNDSRDDEFLVSRIFFLTTYGTNAKLGDLIDKHHLADIIVKNLERQTRHHNDGTPTSDPMVDMALTETLKLLFNITHYCKEKIPQFTQAIPHIVTILCQGTFHVDKPLDSPTGSLVNALLNLELESKEVYSSLYPPVEPTILSDRLIDLLSESRTRYKDEELDSTITALLGVVRTIHNNAPQDVQSSIRDKLLPTEADRNEVLGRSGSLPSWLLKNSTNPLAPELRNTISDLLFDLSDKDASKFVENVGYGFASGFFFNRNIPIPQNASEAFSNAAGGSGRLVNPVTGQFLDSERHPDEPEMTEAEKEREAEKLFVLFQRLQANGIISVENPIRTAVQEGRFEELPDDYQENVD